MMCGSVVQKYQFLILGTAWLTYALTYLLWTPFGVIKPLLEAELRFTKSQLEWLELAQLGLYSLTQVFCSKLVDRFEPRIISLFLALAGWTMVSFGFWSFYWTLLILMGINGALLGPCWPGCCKILYLWYPNDKMNTVIGVLATSAFVGSGAGYALTAYIQWYFGGRIVYVTPSLAAIGFSGLSFLILKTPEDRAILIPGKASNTTNSVIADEEQLEKQSLWSLWRIPAVFEITMSVVLLKVARYCMLMSLPIYLLHRLQYTVAESRLLITIFDIGGAIGCPLIGFIIDLCFTSNGLFGIWFFATVSSISLLLFSVTVQYGLLYSAFFICIAGGTNGACDLLLAGSFSMKTGEYGGRRSGGALTGMVNGIGTFVTLAVGGPIVRILENNFGWEMVLGFMILSSTLSALTVFQAMRIQRRADKLLKQPL